MKGFTCKHCKSGEDAEVFLDVNGETFLLCLACLSDVADELLAEDYLNDPDEPTISGEDSILD